MWRTVCRRTCYIFLQLAASEDVDSNFVTDTWLTNYGVALVVSLVDNNRPYCNLMRLPSCFEIGSHYVVSGRTGTCRVDQTDLECTELLLPD